MGGVPGRSSGGPSVMLVGVDRAAGGLRYGWTTGACATAAAVAAYTALLTGEFPDPVAIVLPKGQRPAFALAREALTSGYAMAGVVKDAGDDPDVTHGALVMCTVRHGAPGSGVTFRAGAGVGTVTKPGLPLAVGEPAINPVPRRLIREHLTEVAARHGDGAGSASGGGARDEAGQAALDDSDVGEGFAGRDLAAQDSGEAAWAAPVEGFDAVTSASGRELGPDVVVEVSVEGGEELARRTWNPRLGILGGLSILGTTGVVVPYSCSAWIESIRRGVDVARAAGRRHVAGCTGSTSERVARERYGLAEDALLDMGDFAGAVLKYLRRHPVPRLTIAGGVGKLAKLADGHLDLHSGRSSVNLEFLASLVVEAGGDRELAAGVRAANTALDALRRCAAGGVSLGDLVAERARVTAVSVLREAPVAVDVIVIDRAGEIVGLAG